MEHSAPDRSPCGPSVWPCEPARIRRWTAPPRARGTDTSAQWGFLVQRQCGGVTGYSLTGNIQHQQCNIHTWDNCLVKWRIWSRDFLPMQGKCCKVSSALCQVCSTQHREILCGNPVIAQSTAGRGFFFPNPLLFMKWRKWNVICVATQYANMILMRTSGVFAGVCADFSKSYYFRLMFWNKSENESH